MKNKKFSKNIITLVALTFLILSSCNTDESLPRQGNKPEVTLESDNITVNEGETATFRLNLSRAINDAVDFKIEVVGGTAIDGEDFDMSQFDIPSIYEGDFGYLGQIPAYQAFADFNIDTFFDDGFEDLETVKFKISTVLEGKGLIANETYLTLNINNSVSNDLSIRLNWDGTFESAGETVDNCDLDFDLELYNQDGDVIEFSYSNCPESLTLSATDLADGTYALYISLWTTGGYFENINIPVNVNFFKQGTAFNVTNNLSEFFPMQDGGLLDGNTSAGIEYTITKSGTVFTITNLDGDTVFQARQSKRIRSSRKK